MLSCSFHSTVHIALLHKPLMPYALEFLKLHMFMGFVDRTDRIRELDFCHPLGATCSISFYENSVQDMINLYNNLITTYTIMIKAMFP